MSKPLHADLRSITLRKLPPNRDVAADCVVILHGLFASCRSMRKIELHLRAAGYRVVNWGYPTFLRTTQHHVKRLVPLIEELERDPEVRSINFVTHSMGGILVRYALDIATLTKVKRVVMLAPPNRGSHLTRISLGPFAWCVPAIADLKKDPDSLPNRLPVPRQVEFGVIASSRDFIVRIADTFLPNQKDHCILAASHFNLPQHEAALNNVRYFLKTGKFIAA